MPRGANRVLLEVLSQPLAARRLHHLAGPVDADAVEPLVARIEEQRCAQRRILAGDDTGDVLGGLIGGDLLAPDLVSEASGVGEQVAQRDLPSWRARARSTGIEAFQHLCRGDVRDNPGCRCVEIKLALLDQLHGRSSRERLGHGGDPADGVDSHWRRLALHALAEGPFIDDRGLVGCHRHDARYVAGLDGVSQGRIDPVIARSCLAGHVNLPCLQRR